MWERMSCLMKDRGVRVDSAPYIVAGDIQSKEASVGHTFPYIICKLTAFWEINLMMTVQSIYDLE